MKAIEYFKRMFEIIFLFSFGMIPSEDTTKRIQGGSVVPLRITTGEN